MTGRISPDQLRTRPTWSSRVLAAPVAIRHSLVLYPHFMTQAEGGKTQRIPWSHAGTALLEVGRDAQKLPPVLRD